MKRKTTLVLMLFLLLNLSCKGKDAGKTPAPAAKEELKAFEKAGDTEIGLYNSGTTRKEYPGAVIPPGERTLATINGTVILESEFNEKLLMILGKSNLEKMKNESPEKLKEAKEQYLNNLINELLVLQEIQEKKISVSVKEVDETIEELKVNNILPKNTVITDTHRKMVKNQIAAQKLIDREVTHGISNPTEKEIENFYRDNKTDIHKLLKQQIYAKEVEKHKEKWIKGLREKATIIKTKTH